MLVKGDTLVEPDETFTVGLGSPTNATLATTQGTGTILNDDTPPALSIDSVSHNEGDSGTTPFDFTISLSKASPVTVTVAYATADGTAVAPADYTATSGSLTFAPGITSQTVRVLVKGDTLVEPTETFTLNLSNPTSATLATAQGIGTIFNDDTAPGTSTTSLTSDPNPSTIGQAVTFVVRVMPVTASGTVTLSEGGTVLGVGTLSGGSLSFRLTNLSLGTHFIVATYGGDATHTPSTSNTLAQVVVAVKSVKPVLLPADLIAELRVTPDREFGLKVGQAGAGAGEDNTLVYSLTVKNIGPGEAENVNVRFPIDPNLVVGYVTSEDAGVWVEQIVSDTAVPYLRIGLPNMEPGSTHTLKVVMRAGPRAVAGSSLFTTFDSYWDDQTGSNHHQRSNGVRLSLTDGTSNRNDTDGAVQLFNLTLGSGDANSSVKVTSDFYAPNEWVDLWYTDGAGVSRGLGSYQADAAGKLEVKVSLSDWPSGTYVIAGRGRRTDTTGAVALTITGAAAPGRAGAGGSNAAGEDEAKAKGGSRSIRLAPLDSSLLTRLTSLK